jgi:hypothetical protein
MACEPLKINKCLNPLKINTGKIELDGGTSKGLGKSAKTGETVGGSLLDVRACENGGGFTTTYLTSLVQEQTNLLGVRIYYQRYQLDLKTHDFLFGEEPNAKFENKRIMTVLVRFNDDALMLGQFGHQTNNDVDMFMAFEEWENTYGKNAQPQPGDRFQLIDLFCRDRDGRTSPWFEVTYKDSGDLVDNINNLNDAGEFQLSEEPSKNVLAEKVSTVDEEARREFTIENGCDDVYGGY